MDMLLKELKDEITEATHEEETAQKDYERLMSDSQASRADKADSITSKEKAKADLDVPRRGTVRQTHLRARGSRDKCGSQRLDSRAWEPASDL